MIDISKIFDELFPIMRSISGDGYRKSIEIFGRHIPLKTHRYPSGSSAFDWTVPHEWNITGATLRHEDGEVICDLRDNNLHVLNYSTPTDMVLPLAELQKHLYSLPDQPSLIPYVTSYYKNAWGFCLSHQKRTTLREGNYHAQINSSLTDGAIEVSDATLRGSTDKIFLISSYLCHPSMANNELSGPLVLLGLYQKLKQTKNLRLSYRFLLNPETIGSICYLSTHGHELRSTMQAGLVLTCMGGPEALSYKFSRSGNSTLDKLMRHMNASGQIRSRKFTPAGGSDERQFCSPGFNLPIGQMARTVYGEYPEYHTSGDTKEFMGIAKLHESIDELYRLIIAHDRLSPIDRHEPNCELQLGKRGLYPNTNFQGTKDQSTDFIKDSRSQLNAISWVLNLADGKNDAIDIAERSEIPLEEIQYAIQALTAAGAIFHKES